MPGDEDGSSMQEGEALFRAEAQDKGNGWEGKTDSCGKREQQGEPDFS